MKTALFIALGIVAAVYFAIWIVTIRKRRDRFAPDLRDGFIGLITNFFDTLGIGSYAPTTAFFKLWRTVPDEEIPGTLNVGDAVPSVLEAFIFISVIQVDVTTLTLMLAAASLGAWFGAGVVAAWPRRKIQVGMGIALLTMAGFFLMKQLQWMPGGGELFGLTGAKLAFAVAVNAILGALMTLGIGMYAPCMILVALLGMNPKVAYPIMMGSCAFLLPVCGVRFIRKERYNLKAALGLTIGGIPGVLAAAFVVKELPLQWVRWLVILVAVYTAIMMLRSAKAERARAAAAPGSAG